MAKQYNIEIEIIETIKKILIERPNMFLNVYSTFQKFKFFDLLYKIFQSTANGVFKIL